MQGKSFATDFVLGNMSKDLMNLAFQYCNKTEENKPRFPKLLQRYSDMIIEVSIEIHKYICIANAIKLGSADRIKYQNIAKGNLIHLANLIDIAYQNKWISEKQHNRWLELCTATYWKLISWIRI